MVLRERVMGGRIEAGGGRREGRLSQGLTLPLGARSEESVADEAFVRR
jgi:hypothetical protein